MDRKFSASVQTGAKMMFARGHKTFGQHKLLVIYLLKSISKELLEH